MKRWIKRAAALSMAIALSVSLAGCWGKHEMTELFFVTGISIDTTDIPGEYAYTLQVAKTQAASSGGTSGGSGSSEKATFLLSATERTMAEAISTINRNASRRVFIHHNQIMLFGADLAREGLDAHIDLFVRDQESRMEVLVAVVDGKAADILSQEMDQDQISGIFLAHVLDSLGSVSPQYQVSLLNFTSRLIEKSIAPIAPILRVEQSGDKAEVVVDGVAVFKNGKMIGTLDSEEMLGYTWAMGGVKNCGVVVQSDQGRAVFRIEQLDCERKVIPKEGGGVKVTLSVSADLSLGEIVGFTDVPDKEIVRTLNDLASATIRQKILTTFEKARALDADIYGFGVDLHRWHKREWHAMAENWDAEFQNIELEVRVASRIPGLGKVIQSVQMEEKK